MNILVSNPYFFWFSLFWSIFNVFPKFCKKKLVPPGIEPRTSWLWDQRFVAAATETLLTGGFNLCVKYFNPLTAVRAFMRDANLSCLCWSWHSAVSEKVWYLKFGPFVQKLRKFFKISLFWKSFNDFFGTGALAPVPKRRKKVHFCGQHFKGVSSVLYKNDTRATRDRTHDLLTTSPAL